MSTHLRGQWCTGAGSTPRAQALMRGEGVSRPRGEGTHHSRVAGRHACREEYVSRYEVAACVQGENTLSWRHIRCSSQLNVSSARKGESPGGSLSLPHPGTVPRPQAAASGDLSAPSPQGQHAQRGLSSACPKPTCIKSPSRLGGNEPHGVQVPGSLDTCHTDLSSAARTAERPCRVPPPHRAQAETPDADMRATL